MSATTGRIRAVAFDYGGVLTNPLKDTLDAFCAHCDIEAEELMQALVALGQEWGEFPMARLEVAACSEAEMTASVLRHLPASVSKILAGRTFGELWFLGRTCEPAAVDLVADVRSAGLIPVLVTNNVAEWGPRWRRQLDVTLFDTVVDSCEEGVRKPDPEIYQRLLDRLGLKAPSCLVVDDLEENCRAAAAMGIATFHWQGPQSAPVLRHLLGLPPVRNAPLLEAVPA